MVSGLESTLESTLEPPLEPPWNHPWEGWSWDSLLMYVCVARMSKFRAKCDQPFSHRTRSFRGRNPPKPGSETGFFRGGSRPGTTPPWEGWFRPGSGPGNDLLGGQFRAWNRATFRLGIEPKLDQVSGPKSGQKVDRKVDHFLARNRARKLTSFWLDPSQKVGLESSSIELDAMSTSRQKVVRNFLDPNSVIARSWSQLRHRFARS